MSLCVDNERSKETTEVHLNMIPYLQTSTFTADVYPIRIPCKLSFTSAILPDDDRQH